MWIAWNLEIVDKISPRSHNFFFLPAQVSARETAQLIYLVEYEDKKTSNEYGKALLHRFIKFSKTGGYIYIYIHICVRVV